MSLQFIPYSVALIPPLPESLERELREYLKKTYRQVDYEIWSVTVKVNFPDIKVSEFPDLDIKYPE